MANAEILIASQSLSATALTVTFSSIPSTYRDLKVVIVGKMATSATATDAFFRINSDATATYNRASMVSNGTTTSSTLQTNGTEFYLDGWSTTNPATYEIIIMDYAQTDKHKSFAIRGANAENLAYRFTGRWASTAAINSLTFYGTDQAGAGTPDQWTIGSTFFLYGVLG